MRASRATSSFLALVTLASAVALAGVALAGGEVTLLNVSYDPTRELWRDINASFAAR